MNYLYSVFLSISLILPFSSITASDVQDEITPYKFTDEDKGVPLYDIPVSSRFTAQRITEGAPPLIYYLSKPHEHSYPIVIMCGGSSNKDQIESIIHFHRYFLQEFKDRGVGVLTVEQWGVDGKKINAQEFVNHYTRSQRLQDHQQVIEHLKVNPPFGWNGKLIFLGVSEGGPIVTTLTEKYGEVTIATINWSGAGDWSWSDELWTFLQYLILENPECSHKLPLSDCSTCLELMISKESYDTQMDLMIQNPATDQYFLNMSYKYHADAIFYPKPHYQKLQRPFLVVAGAKDSFIESSDAFVKKAKCANVNITYLRIVNMDHYIRKRSDIIQQSFDWLDKQIMNSQLESPRS